MYPGLMMRKEALDLGNVRQIYLFTLCLLLAPAELSSLH